MVTLLQGTYTSTTVSSRRVDNTAVRGYDVQTANHTGGTAGKPEVGDSLTLTWTKVMNASTLVSGWSGSGSIALTVKFVDGAKAGFTSSDDVVQLQTSSGGTTGLGSVELKANVVGSSGSTFTANGVLSTAASGGSQLVITLASKTAGSPKTASTTGNPVWTPAATATDLAGNATSTAPVTASGAAKKPF
jgi:hypothetical protein